MCYAVANTNDELIYLALPNIAPQTLNRCIEKDPTPAGPNSHPDPGSGPVPPRGTVPAEETLLHHAPSEADIGAILFFKGVCLSHLGRLADALTCFLEAVESPWAVRSTVQRAQARNISQAEQVKWDSGRDRNRMICFFAIAKVHQRDKKHLLAVEHFTKAFETLPQDKDIAFVLFRRAWSYKVRWAGRCMTSSSHALLLPAVQCGSQAI